MIAQKTIFIIGRINEEKFNFEWELSWNPISTAQLTRQNIYFKVQGCDLLNKVKVFYSSN